MPYSYVEMAKLIAVGETAIDNGEAVQVWFDNGLGLSIAYHAHAYSDEGTCELAALKRDESALGGWDVVYSSANGWADVRPYQSVWQAFGAAVALALSDPAEFTTDMD